MSASSMSVVCVIQIFFSCLLSQSCFAFCLRAMLLCALLHASARIKLSPCLWITSMSQLFVAAISHSCLAQLVSTKSLPDPDCSTFSDAELSIFTLMVKELELGGRRYVSGCIKFRASRCAMFVVCCWYICVYCSVKYFF